MASDGPKQSISRKVNGMFIVEFVEISLIPKKYSIATYGRKMKIKCRKGIDANLKYTSPLPLLIWVRCMRK